MTIEANKQLALEFMAAIGAEDWDRMAALMTEDGTWEVPGTLSVSGSYDRDALVLLMKGMAARFSTPVNFQPDGVIAEGNKVAIECHTELDTTDGKQYRNRYHMLYEIRDGRIARLVEYCDTKHVHDVFLS